jgi:hypothetical protein
MKPASMTAGFYYGVYFAEDLDILRGVEFGGCWLTEQQGFEPGALGEGG